MPTANQLILQQNIENNRHNTVTESETKRHNAEDEAIRTEANRITEKFNDDTTRYRERMAAIEEIRSKWQEEQGWAGLIGAVPDKVKTALGLTDKQWEELRRQSRAPDTKLTFADIMDAFVLKSPTSMYAKWLRNNTDATFGKAMDKLTEFVQSEYNDNAVVPYQSAVRTVQGRQADETARHNKAMEELGTNEFLAKMEELSKQLELMDKQISVAASQANLNNAMAYNDWWRGAKTQWEYDNRWLMWGVESGIKTVNAVGSILGFDFRTMFTPSRNKEFNIPEWDKIFGGKK